MHRAVANRMGKKTNSMILMTLTPSHKPMSPPISEIMISN